MNTEPAKGKVRVQIKEGQRCTVCKQVFLDDKKNLLKPIMSVPGFGEVHEACFMPYHQEDELRLLVKIRCYSIGDTIATTPAIRELRRIYPRAKITVITVFPDLFKYNPLVDEVLDMNYGLLEETMKSYHYIIDPFVTEGVHHHFAVHSGEFAFQSAFHRSGIPTQYEYEIFYHQDDRTEMRKIADELGVSQTKPLIFVNPHKTEWETRDWGPVHMQRLVDKLAKTFDDHQIVSIGGKRGEAKGREMPNYVKLNDKVIDAYGKFSLLQSIAFMDQPNVKLLITPDTGTLHMGAACQELPIVGIFTVVKAYFRTPVRKGRFGYKFTGVESDSGCCCSYDAKLYSVEMRINTCPKKAFLENTLKCNLPKGYKREGMKNFDPSREWPIESLGDDVRKELAIYSKPSLPCFPSVDKVYAACERMLNGN